MKKDWSSGLSQDSRAPGDSSALFSLGELKAKAIASAESSSKAHALEDNSGLIDLRALMAKAERDEKAKAEEQALRVSEHIGVYPFGSPSSTPLVATAPVPEPVLVRGPLQRPRSRSRLWSGALAGAIVGIGAIAFAALSSGGSPWDSALLARPALSDLAARRIPSPVLQGAAAGQPISGGLEARGGEQPSPTEPASPDRLPKIGLHVPRAPVMNRTPVDGSKAKASPGPSGQVKPAAADPCHGDLMCAMQRAIKNEKK